MLAALAIVVGILAVGAVACGDDGDEVEEPTATESMETAAPTQAGETPTEGVISVNLTEYIVAPNPESAPAGEVTFNARNIGGEDHELVVIRTDLAPDSLPTVEDGSVDETGEGIDAIGEIEEFPSGEEQSATFTLEVGAYALICNIVTDDGVSHYQEGMYAPFQVTE
jgi:hypothetical protein